MTKENVIHIIGEDRYHRASSSLQAHARDPEYGSNRSFLDDTDADEVPHVASPAILDSDLSIQVKLELFFEVYSDLPSYGMLMYATMKYIHWDKLERGVWWKEFRTHLKGEWHRPLAYVLWCDFFEDPETVEESWAALTQPIDKEILPVILSNSGPVPWAVKASLFGQMTGDRTLHRSIFEGILHSQFDVYGDIDRSSASELLKRLKVDEGERGYAELKKALSGE